MLLRIEGEKRPHGWHVEARGVPGTASVGLSYGEALGATLDKLAEKARRRELTLPIDVLIAETPPPGQRSFTGADLLALWRALAHDDPSWADDLEKVTRSQPTIADEPSPWQP